MSTEAPQLVRAAPGLATAAKARGAILTLTHSALAPAQHVKLRELLGDLISGAWCEGYRAATEENRL